MIYFPFLFSILDVENIVSNGFSSVCIINQISCCFQLITSLREATITRIFLFFVRITKLFWRVLKRRKKKCLFDFYCVEAKRVLVKAKGWKRVFISLYISICTLIYAISCDVNLLMSTAMIFFCHALVHTHFQVKTLWQSNFLHLLVPIGKFLQSARYKNIYFLIASYNGKS